ncbi:hypothetical protein VNO78_13116 [Psophocarpus tetragonolobus]|uniref:E3 ubiquitin-protein ligase RMA n=1 Tax=Psophocarpus tetragonolobus TaxID=3891 RepID=A0AAN9SNT6_PSOTE
MVTLNSMLPYARTKCGSGGAVVYVLGIIHLLTFAMELDLNQEHLGQIEGRIRCLEAVVFRERQRQRRQPSHTPIRITNNTGELITVSDVEHEERALREVVGDDVGVGRMGNKRKASYLVAKALGVEANEGEGCSANLFHCNICFDKARDPVLTCCGHLFCWPCFHKLSYAYSNAKECPVCKGEVTDEGIIPIYGNDSVESSGRLELDETGFRVPARPRAQRNQSTRQRFRH